MNINAINLSKFFVSAYIPKNFFLVQEDKLTNKVSIQERTLSATAGLSNSQSIITISSASPLVVPITKL